MRRNADDGLVEHYLRELREGDRENAFHRLIEAGPRIIPSLQRAFDGEADADTRAGLVEIIWQFRRRETVRFLARALDDPAPAVWKAALDGLVTISCADSREALKAALDRWSLREDATRYKDCVQEALDQAGGRS